VIDTYFETERVIKKLLVGQKKRQERLNSRLQINMSAAIAYRYNKYRYDKMVLWSDVACISKGDPRNWRQLSKALTTSWPPFQNPTTQDETSEVLGSLVVTDVTKFNLWNENPHVGLCYVVLPLTKSADTLIWINMQMYAHMLNSMNGSPAHKLCSL
jgi:hypothetical protein